MQFVSVCNLYLYKGYLHGTSMTGSELSQESITRLFTELITELHQEPAFHKEIFYATENGTPSVKTAVGNVPLTYDLWKGLRNPALVGLYPAGLREIWEFYAHRRKTGIDASGRPTIFSVPKSFDSALKEYKRAVIISVMLPFSPHIIEEYTETFFEEETGSSHLYAQMYEDVNVILDRATSRAALNLVEQKRAVIPMNSDTVENVSTEAVPPTRQGTSHGPSKGGNYSQKSIAALLGLGQLGVHRLIFRDEVISGTVHRFTGPLRSIVVFDSEDVTTSESMMYPGESWRQFLVNLYDFTNTDPAVNAYRFCTYVPLDDEGCGLCRQYCPSGAQSNSMPGPTGEYAEEILRQAHRFWEGKLQFDHAQCCEERGQMALLFPEWSCARGLSVCASRGKKRKGAVSAFYKKMHELTKE
jgi:hypothetical protein